MSQKRRPHRPKKDKAAQPAKPAPASRATAEKDPPPAPEDPYPRAGTGW